MVIFFIMQIYVIILSLLFCEINQVKKVDRVIPTKFDGWEAIEKDEIYNTDNLFDFIDGGAELYLAYGFKELFVRRFSKTNYPFIEVNIFDMGSPKNAFGIFHHDLEDEEVKIGQGSEYGAGWLRFWKGRYFVYIFSERETPTIKHTILNLGRLISKNITPSEIKINLLKFLPQDGMINKSLRFCYNPTILNYHFYISNQNILNISEKTEVVFAKYHLQQGNGSLLLIQYQNKKQATNAYKNFIKIYLPEARETSIVKTENGKWCGTTLKDKYLIIVLDASSSIFANNLIDSVLKNFDKNHEEN